METIELSLFSLRLLKLIFYHKCNTVRQEVYFHYFLSVSICKKMVSLMFTTKHHK